VAKNPVEESPMHRTTTLAMAAAAAVAAVSTAAGGALAAPSAAWPGTAGHAAPEQAQYYSDWRGPRDIEEHRWLHRQRLRAYEEERVAEAARRKALRAEKERAERRAWRHALRERYWRHDGL
jgi:hypothetical protein